MKVLFLTLILSLTGILSYSQVGINTTAPDSSAILDLRSFNKGLLIPTLTTTQREAMAASPPTTGLANGLLVFDIDLYSFYFWDTNVNKWVSVNPWRKEYTDVVGDAEHVTTDLNATSNVGVAQTSPNSKLTVNGNLSVGNTNTAAPTNGAYIDGKVRIGSSAGSTDQLEVGGNTTTTGTANADEFVGRGVTPVGGIIMYSGSTAGLFDGSGLGTAGTKMEGWAICNGSNGTPNLQDKFVVGAGNSYSLGNTGGENTHTLIVGEMPTHTHTGTTGSAGSHRHNMSFDSGGGGSYDGTHITVSSTSCGTGSGCGGDGLGYTNYAGTHTHTFTTDPEGSSLPHENRPPYYAVYYIMRIN